MGRVYEAPLPTYLYALGAAATVAASFAIRALAGDELRDRQPRRLLGPGAARVATVGLRGVGFAGLFLALLSGGLVRGSGLLLAPLLFWVGLIVLTAAVNAVIDGAWRATDPWAALDDLYRLETPSRIEPPWWLGPLMLYGLFWFELVSGVGFSSPTIAAVLAGYSIFVFAFRRRFGSAWRDTDPLSVLFGFAGRGAPLVMDSEGISYRGPVAGLDEREPMHLSLFASVFVLLGATTLDNVRETVGWSSFLATTRVGDLPDAIVDSFALIAFAGLFYAPFALSLLLARRWMTAARSFGDTTRRFAWSLVPIGVAYLLAHNAPLLMTGVPQLIRQLSDPFDRGWNLLGTIGWFEGYMPSPAFVWFLEIALIVGGHVIAVLVAHRTAVRVAGSHRAAVMSQVALTTLMSFFTVTTLALLAQPLVV
ncbi:MAG TPA: hypothetical protein VG408_07130 [Actinomycetota bacterium]|nr:hypothetical protein [Actinomycetota bacterium]